jgi:hypothetical protein
MVEGVLLQGVGLLPALRTIGVAAVQPPAVLAHLHRE